MMRSALATAACAALLPSEAVGRTDDRAAGVAVTSDARAVISRPASARDSVITSVADGADAIAVTGDGAAAVGRGGGIASAGALSWRGISIGMSTGTGPRPRFENEREADHADHQQDDCADQSPARPRARLLDGVTCVDNGGRGGRVAGAFEDREQTHTLQTAWR
jgi:hypothetical protein